jgi:Flp pilus assembly pilin Flp
MGSVSTESVSAVTVRGGAVALPAVSERTADLNALAKFGPHQRTTVVVNGRQMLLYAAHRLVAGLPEGTVVSRLYRHLSISPDPFVAHAPLRREEPREEIPSGLELVARMRTQHVAREREEAIASREQGRFWAWLCRRPSLAPQAGQTNVELGAILVLVSIVAIPLLLAIAGRAEAFFAAVSAAF